MKLISYRRHNKACTHGDDKFYKHCECPVWFEANVRGRRWDTDANRWIATP